jgi:hypothetical protein
VGTLRRRYTWHLGLYTALASLGSAMVAFGCLCMWSCLPLPKLAVGYYTPVKATLCIRICACIIRRLPREWMEVEQSHQDDPLVGLAALRPQARAQAVAGSEQPEGELEGLPVPLRVVSEPLPPPRPAGAGSSGSGRVGVQDHDVDSDHDGQLLLPAPRGDSKSSPQPEAARSSHGGGVRPRAIAPWIASPSSPSSPALGQGQSPPAAQLGGVSPGAAGVAPGASGGTTKAASATA